MNSAVAAQKPSRAAPAPATVAPILAASHKQIRALGALRSTSLAHIRRAVEGDAALALNLFSDVNAKLKQVGHAPVGDIGRAILFLGMADLPARLTRGAVLEDVVPAPQIEEFTQMLCRAHHAAWQAHAIASLTNGLNPEELLAASLAREGLPFITAIAAQTAVKLNLAAFNNFLPAPPENSNAKNLSETCLALAGQFADITANAWDEQKLEALYAELHEATGRDIDLIAKTLERATVHAAHLGAHFRAYPAAIHLMSPGILPAAVAPASKTIKLPPRRTAPASAAPEPARAKAGSAFELKVPPRTAALTTPKVIAKTAPQHAKAAAKQKPESKSNTFAGALGSLQQAVSSGRPAAEIMPLSLQEICDHAGVELAVLLMLDKKTGDLKIRLAKGATIPAALKALPIALDKNPLLAKLLNAEAAFHWRPDKHSHALSGAPLTLLGQRDGFLYSLVIAGKPLGIIMGRSARSADDDGRESFARFKKICSENRRSLESATRAEK